MELAPDELGEFARKHGVSTVFFVDDRLRCKNSVRADGDIFINTRCTYWGNMIPPPFCCRDAAEAILLRFLHEVAHVFYSHCGDENVTSSPDRLSIKCSADFFARNFTGQEGQAWRFALRLRVDDPEEYQRLHDAIHGWTAQHVYHELDWDYSADPQWRRIQGRELSEEIFHLPDWVKSEFM